MAEFDFVCPPACLIRVYGSKQQKQPLISQGLRREITQVAVAGKCALMLIKHISHLVGVNGTQVTINLTLCAVLSCVPASWLASGIMEGMWYEPKSVCACLHVFAL